MEKEKKKKIILLDFFFTVSIDHLRQFYTLHFDSKTKHFSFLFLTFLKNPEWNEQMKLIWMTY